MQIFRRLLASSSKANQETARKCLQIAVIGAPNVGKSLLTNNIVRCPLSAVSSKMDTTTRNIEAAICEDSTQLVVVDSPGAVSTSHARETMKNGPADPDNVLMDAEKALRRAQQIVVVQDSTAPGAYIHHRVLHMLHRYSHVPSVLVMNKIDLVIRRSDLLPLVEILTNGQLNDQKIETKPAQIGRLGKSLNGTLKSTDLPNDEKWRSLYRSLIQKPTYKCGYSETRRLFRNVNGWSGFDRVFFVSSLTSEGIDALRTHLIDVSPPGDWKLDESRPTNESAQQLCRDSIRAAVLDTTPSDVAYTVRVGINEWDESGEILQIVADIKCLKPRDGVLIIGKTGRRISEIGRRVNEHLHSLFQRQLYDDNNNNTEELVIVSDDDTLYTTCPEITISYMKDASGKKKRTITIDSKHKSRDRTRRSDNLHRRALVNSAIRSSASSSSQTESSRSRSRPSSDEANKILDGAYATNRKKRVPTSVRKNALHHQGGAKLEIAPRLDTLDQRRADPTAIINLPSPLYILSEQQVTGVPQAKAIEFVTRILLTTKKLLIDKKETLIEEMAEARLVGGCRSSTNLADDDEPHEDFDCRVFYSDKGILIETRQIVHKVDSNRRWITSEEKTHSNICKTKIIGMHGKHVDGFLNVQIKESIEAINQNYKRCEEMIIGFKGDKTEGFYEIKADTKTFDPTKTIKFSERIMFDSKNIGISIKHDAVADMSRHWTSSQGTFGEQHCDYREVHFKFDEATPSMSAGGKPAIETSGKTPKKSPTLVQTAARTPTNPSTKKDSSSFFQSTPQATSTPKSDVSPVSLRPTSAKPALTPTDRVGTPVSTPSLRKSSPAPPPQEVDLDKSLSKSRVARNLSKVIDEGKKANAESVEAPKTPPPTLRDDNSGSGSSSNSESRKTTRASVHLGKRKSRSADTSPVSGQLRIKETKIVREVRERVGKPPQIKEHKEETVKVQPVAFARGGRPTATPIKHDDVTMMTFNVTVPHENTTTTTTTTTPTTPTTPTTLSSPKQSRAASTKAKLKSFPKALILESTVNGKPYLINMNIDFQAYDAPKVDVNKVVFDKRVFFEKSVEWNPTTSSITTSQVIGIN
ncbi:unnamed protein product [Caenorhabditis bovis]|uniref:G domain-containing protein n=1 Tax=Caenorhabditis bovis TaxID=2654633 RepID=A0A8S1EV37_9PELO|nr:unnamed protein product [Caenorhabditis bovis]